ncbi:MAG: RsmB/NOP family class I SAM-dependent RNA methyltransferase [Pseudomonadota bacterium]
MRLPGRVAAAIECLGPILGGAQVEAVLRGWARDNRYAGSKDRSAIRDMIYDVLRKRQSCAALGGGDDPRALMLGWAVSENQDLAEIFGADRFGPEGLSETERDHLDQTVQLGDVWNMPDWLAQKLKSDYGDEAKGVAKALTDRAPIDLRVHASRAKRDHIQEILAGEGIETVALSTPNGLRLTGHHRAITQLPIFQDGLIELQDAQSQAICNMIPIKKGQAVLDYCAGGGGKSLALAARVPQAVFMAWDAHKARLKDLPDRAARAQSDINLAENDPANEDTQYDVVLLDVPCSGSGSWRRDPQGKWSLTPEQFDQILDLQADILRKTQHLVRPGGVLAYVTCSVFLEENIVQIQDFTRDISEFSNEAEHQFLPSEGGDGFFLCLLRRKNVNL